MLILYLYAASVLRRGNFIRRHQDKETPLRCRAIKIFPRKTPLSLLFSQGHYEPLLFLYRRLAPVIQEKKSPRSNSATVPFSPEMNKETRRPWPSKGPPPPPLFFGITGALELASFDRSCHQHHWNASSASKRRVLVPPIPFLSDFGAGLMSFGRRRGGLVLGSTDAPASKE